MKAEQQPAEADEEGVFLQAMDGVTPLAQEPRAAPWRPRIPPRPLNHPHFAEEEEPDRLSEQEIETGDELSWLRPGLQLRVFHDLRRGRIAVHGELDLHGFTTHHAREELTAFLAECRRRQARCVRIIHGKGQRSEGQQPILKQRVNLWLRQREEVLAFCSATSRDGGTGAAYVLLRNSRRKRD